MGDLLEILKACQNETATGQPAALATVVNVEGSAYRRPGARMLIHENGGRVGSLSGGCLEADVAERALYVARSGQPEYVLYDAKAAGGDLIAETGCGGAVGILIESLQDSRAASGVDLLAAMLNERGRGFAATVFHVEGCETVRVGDRLTWQEGKGLSGNLGDVHLTKSIIEEASVMSLHSPARSFTCTLPTGSIDVLLEPILPPIALILCGAGHDALPMAHAALALGWQVTVADRRPAVLTAGRFPAECTLLATSEGGLPKEMLLDDRTAAIIMTHSFSHDLEWLRHLLPSPVCYVGLLGAQTRAGKLRSELCSTEGNFDSECWSRLYTPAGLNLGAETPAEIALSVIAEIQAVVSRRSGGSLRDSKSPIHAPMPLNFSWSNDLCPLSAS